MVKAAVAANPLSAPLPNIPYWPGCTFGTLKLILKLPPALTVGEPTVWPLKVTSTVSPGLKSEPLAVIVAPGRPDDVDNFSEALGRGVALASGAGAVPTGA